MLAAGPIYGLSVGDTTGFALGLHPASASSSFLALRRLSNDVPAKSLKHGPTLKGASLQGGFSALDNLEHDSSGVRRTRVGSLWNHQSDPKRVLHAPNHTTFCEPGDRRLWWYVKEGSVARAHGRRVVTCSTKKSGKNGGNEETSGKQATPPRVSTNINIPVRYQLRYVKALKEYQKNATRGPPVRQTTGYRKKKERTSEGSGDVVAPSTSLMGQGVMEDLKIDPPVLLVDGYNMCGYWPKLKKHFAKGDLEAARSKLIVELQAYGACKGIRVVVVFDAQNSGLTSHSEGDKYVEVVFSADDTADSWIESEAQSLRDQGNHNVWVVTSDLAQQSMAYGFGATVWSCGLLIQEINQARKDMLKQLEEDRFIGDLSARQPTFEEAVSRDSFDKLASLYERLSRAEDGLSDDDDDVSSREDDVSSQYDDVRGREDDVMGRFKPNEDDLSDRYSSDHDDHDADGSLELDADDVSGWAGGNHRGDAGRSNWENESEEFFALRREGGDERRASGALAETTGRSDAAELTETSVRSDASGGESKPDATGRPDAAAVRAIPVAFGKGRVDLGAAVKRRRQSGGGYSSGSDSEGPPQRVARKRAQDLEIFQRYDTLPDFGYSTGDDDHRGRMHRGWRDVERAVEDGKARGTENGTNGKSRGMSGAVSGASRGQASGTNGTGKRSNGMIMNGTNGTGNGTNGSNGMSNGTDGMLCGTNGMAKGSNGMGSEADGRLGGINLTVGGAQNGANGEAFRGGPDNNGRGAQDSVRNGAVWNGGHMTEMGGAVATQENGVSGNDRIAGQATGKGLGSPRLGSANGNKIVLGERSRSSAGSGGGGYLGHEESVESTGQEPGFAGAPLVIRGTTKRVPGQSPRVVKPRDKELEHAARDETGERSSVAHRGSNGRVSAVGGENGARNGLKSDGNGRVAEESTRVGGKAGLWDLVADARLMRSPLVPNGTFDAPSDANGEGKRKGKGRSTVGNGMSSEGGSRSEYKPGGDVTCREVAFGDFEGTPFDELTSEQMLALKYGHTSKPGSENEVRSSARQIKHSRKRNSNRGKGARG